MRKKQAVWLAVALCAGVIGVMPEPGRANNLALSGAGLANPVTGQSWMVRFSIQWENSWRVDLAGTNQAAPFNYDAAWVFVKYKTTMSGGWKHATLSTNAADYIVPSGCSLAVGQTTNRGVGAFIYRSANSGGTFNATHVGLKWNCATDGIGVPDTVVTAKVCAIEMVYVPQGAFKVGDGMNDQGQFYEGGGGTTPYLIAGEAAIPTSNQVGCLWGASQAGISSMGGDGYISNSFPKGYSAFYGMKYEISQGQYADFLNTIDPAHATTRYPNQNGNNRQGITVSGGVYTSSLPYVACNWLSWADVAAYLDWSGLRPMTELEFEKTCRGPSAPVAGEYAWGSAGGLVQATSIVNEGLSNEAPGNAGANCAVANAGGVPGPMRVGCMGIGAGTRVGTGAGYYGMLELSGNLWERSVTVGNDTGRSFTGQHGDGVLSGTGAADVTGWPSGADAIGVGFRGGNWGNVAAFSRVADRRRAAYVDAPRTAYYGGRGVRSSP